MSIPLLSAAQAALPAGAKQRGALLNIVRLFALLVVLTLVARGTAGATMPTVTTARPGNGAVHHTLRAGGSIASAAGSPFTLPEGLLVQSVPVQLGQTVEAGAVLATFDSREVEQAIALAQAELAQNQLKARQLAQGETTDPFALQQAQDQLQRSYQNFHKTDAAGQQSVEEAKNARGEAERKVNEVRDRKPTSPRSDEFAAMATPEQASAQGLYDAWKAELGTAEAQLKQAEETLKLAEQAAEAELDAALAAAQSVEDGRNSALNSYEKELENNAESNAADRADANVLSAQVAQAQTKLDALRALSADGYVCKAPFAGTLTALELAPGKPSGLVGGLLADADAGYLLTLPLTEEQAKLVAVGDTLTVTQGKRSGKAAITALSAPDADGAVIATAQLPPDSWAAGAATVTADLTGTGQGTTLPTTAIQADSQGNYVYIIEEQSTVLGLQNVLVRMSVTVLERGDTTTLVSSALNSGSLVVSGSNKPLSAGASVRLAEP